jgi:glycosyltransferase involved in cell wall biosynthesis
MRVLIASQYFPPEITASAARNHAFALALAERGHEVRVVAEAPSHPHGVIAPGYRRPVNRRRIDGIDVSYVWIAASPKKSAARRILNYASYAAMASAAGSTMRGVDVVLASSPPLSVGAAGAALAGRHRVPWVLDVRDLWPEIAVAMGELRGDRLIAGAERLERSLYRGAARIVTVTEPFRQAIERRGGEGKVSVVPNGTTRTWLDLASSEPDRDALGLPADRFVWTYAGNLGRAQGLDAAVDAAGELGDGFQLLVVGDGPEKTQLEQRAARLPAGSVAFRAAVPGPLAAELMRASDALLVPLAGWPVLESFVPSKLFDSCAVARPVIVAAAGEPSRLAGDAVLAVSPEDAGELADAVRRLRDEPDLREELGRRGFEFASEHERGRGAERVAELLEELAASPA